jgi:hypothetical protein
VPRVRGWEAKAYNQVPESENRIHSDEVAKRHGFRGGLVPGVTVSAYLMHPALEAWGLDWLSRGAATAVVKKPLYDGVGFRVEVEPAAEYAYDAVLTDADGVECAEGHVELPKAAASAPGMRGDPQLSPGYERPRASREAFERLGERGLQAVRARWSAEAEIVSYLRDAEAMAEPVRPSGAGYANPAFVLGLTNWALAANVYLSPWLHLQTEHQNFAPIPPGSELVVETAVADLFERKGHEFVDAEVAAFLLDETPVMRARLRAIYRLRGS